MKRGRASLGATVIIGIGSCALILTGALAPSSVMIARLRGTLPPGPFAEQLLLGGMLFKGGLILLGVAGLIMGRTLLRQGSVPNKARPAGRYGRFEIVALGILLLVSLALNLYRLGDGLWYDEIVTYVIYVGRPFGEIITTYETQNQHLLYSILAHLCVQVFGDSVWSLRLPAALFGAGSVVALYLLGREVTTRREALLAAALLTLSYHHVWFSQNARGYTGLLFWTLVASWFFVRALDEGRPLLWVFYAVSAALGAYTLIYMLFVILGHFGIYLRAVVSQRGQMRNNKWSGFFLGFCLAGILTFELYALVLPQFFSAFGTVEVVGRTWTDPLWAVLEFVKGMRLNLSGGVVMVAAGVVFAAGLISFTRANPVVIQLLVIPAVICVAVKWGMGHHLWPRSLIFAVGFGALVVVRGAMVVGQLASRLLKQPATKSTLVGTGLCCSMIAVSALSVRSAYGPKQDYQGALDFVQRRKQPNDNVVTVGLATFPYKRYYKTNWQEAGSLEELNGIRSRPGRTWLIYTLPIQLRDAQPEIMAAIDRDFKIVERFRGTLIDGDVFVRRADPLPAQAAGRAEKVDAIRWAP